MYNHFLITRFNIPYAHYARDRSGNCTLDETWLRQRFELFERYCLPSVLGQTNQNFIWLVFFDSGTPEEFKQKINHYEETCALFKPCYVSAMREFPAALNAQIRCFLSPISTRLITSRVDNDDALHSSYIDRVQAVCASERDVILNFRFGYCFDCLKNTLYFCAHESNPFISRVEMIGGGEFETVMSFNHTEALMHAPVRQLCEIGWMVVIHGRNLSNQSTGRPIFFPEKVFGTFGVRPESGKLAISYRGLLVFYARALKRSVLNFTGRGRQRHDQH